MEYPTEQESVRLAKLAALDASEIGWELVDLLRTAVVLHKAALLAWLAAGPPEMALSVPEVQLCAAATDAVAVALSTRFLGTPLGAAEGPDFDGAVWLIATRLASSVEKT